MARFEEDPLEEEVVGMCEHCEAELYKGHAAFFDAREDAYYCDEYCFKEYIKANIQHEVNDFIDLLDQNGDVTETILY